MSHLQDYVNKLEEEKGADFSRLSITMLHLGVELGVVKPKLGQVACDKIGMIAARLAAEIALLRGFDGAELAKHQKAMVHLLKVSLEEGNNEGHTD